MVDGVLRCWRLEAGILLQRCSAEAGLALVFKLGGMDWFRAVSVSALDGFHALGCLAVAGGKRIVIRWQSTPRSSAMRRNAMRRDVMGGGLDRCPGGWRSCLLSKWSIDQSQSSINDSEQDQESSLSEEKKLSSDAGE